MMNQAKHAYVLIGIVAVGTVLFLTGIPGGLLFWLWPLTCLAMMAWLMWSMRGTGPSAADPANHIHEDGVTHAYRSWTPALLGLPAEPPGPELWTTPPPRLPLEPSTQRSGSAGQRAL